MSELTYDLEFRFATEDLNGLFGSVLEDYNADSKSQFSPLISRLAMHGLNGRGILEIPDLQCSVDAVIRRADRGLRCRIWGGVHDAYDLWEWLYGVLRAAGVEVVTAVGFNTQVCEYEIDVYRSGANAKYSTGLGGRCDAEIRHAVSEGTVFEVVGGLFEQGRLIMPERDDDEIPEI